MHHQFSTQFLQRENRLTAQNAATKPVNVTDFTKLQSLQSIRSAIQIVMMGQNFTAKKEKVHLNLRTIHIMMSPPVLNSMGTTDTN